MKLNYRLKFRATRQGFTLIEIIGVLAIIAFLAALLTPKVFNVVGRGKVNSTALAYNTVKTATTDYFAQVGGFPIRSGTGTTNGPSVDGRFDADLLAAGLLEKLFSCAIGQQDISVAPLTERTHVRTLTGISSPEIQVPEPETAGNNFNLDRDPTTADFTRAQTVVSVFIPQVAVTDAVSLNKIIDGDDNLGSRADVTGKLMYSNPAEGFVNVSIYVAHY